VEYIHKNKTAALIRACVRTGVLFADGSDREMENLSVYGDYVGLAFQVVDDILDEEGTTEQLGKDAGSDKERGKVTYPSVCGMAESKRYAQELIQKACGRIEYLGERAAVLKALAEFFRTRIS
jgi:geranylgeranyl diphosphate synthase, type II